jgi:hypothetical protein
MLWQLYILNVLDQPTYLEMGLLDGLVNLIAQVVLRALQFLWDALIQLVEDELLQLVQLGLSFSGRLIDINKVLPIVIVLLLQVFTEVFELFALSDQLRHGELLFLECIKLFLEVLSRVLLILLNLLIQGLLSSLDLELIVSFKSRDLLGHDLSLGELLHSCLHSMQLSLDLVDGFLKLAFLSGHCQLSLISDHINTLGSCLLEDSDALVDSQGRSFLLFLKPEKGGLLPLARFLQEDLSIKELLVSLVLAVDHEFESVDNWRGNIFPSVRLKFQNSIKSMDLHLLLKHGFFVIHYSA